MDRCVKVNKKRVFEWLLLFIQIFPLVIPMGLSYVLPSLYQFIYGYWQKTAFLIIIAIFLICFFKNPKNDFRNIFLILIPGYALLLTLFYGGSFSSWYTAYIMPIMIFMIINTNIKRLTMLLDVFLIILEFWIVINLIFMVKYPGGIYYNTETRYYLNWLLGYKSSLQYYILPALCFKWMKSKYNGKLMGFYILLAVCFAETIIGQNSMLAVGLVILSFILMFNLFRLKVFCSSTFYLAVIIANFLIIVTNEVLANNYYWLTLLSFFGKTSAISGRVAILWPKTIRAIANYPIFGNGMLSTIDRIILNGGFAGATHAHNQILEFLFVGGIVMLVMFVIYNIKINFALTENYCQWSAIAIAVSLFVLYLMVTVEVFTTFNGAAIWLVIGLALYNRELDIQFKFRQERSIV